LRDGGHLYLGIRCAARAAHSCLVRDQPGCPGYTNTLLEWIIRPNRTLHVVWNHGLTVNPNLLQGGQTLTGTSFIVKLDWGVF